MDAGLFTKPWKVRWYIVWSTLYFSYMNLFRCLYCIEPFVFIFITINNDLSYHIVDAYIVSLIIAIDPRCITASSLHEYF